MFKSKFGYFTDKHGNLVAYSDKLNCLRLKELKIQGIIINKMKKYYSKVIEEKEIINSSMKAFGTFNQLTSNLYFNITTKYLMLFISIIIIYYNRILQAYHTACSKKEKFD